MSLSKNSEGGIGVLALRAAASFEAAKLEMRRDTAKEGTQQVYFLTNKCPFHNYIFSFGMHLL